MVVYLDDICVHGPNWESVWEKTLKIIKCLTDAGFMINL